MSMYLTATNPNGGGSGFPSDVNQNSKKTGYIATQTDPLTIRSGPGTGYGSVGTIARNTTVDYYTTSLSTSWYYVVYGSIKGYGSAQYILPSSGGGTVPSGQKYVYVLANNTAVYVSPGGALTANRWPINRRAIVTVYDNTWYKTVYKGTDAYIRQDACGAVSTAVHSSITDRMNFIATYEKGQTDPKYYDNGSGNFCHLFVDWLAKHSGLSSARVPNESGCGWGIVRWINKLGGIGSGFFFTTAAYKAHMKSGYPGNAPDGLNAISSTLTAAETSFTPKTGDYVYIKWSGEATGEVRVNHVGWIYNVAGGKIYTWEGNSTNGAVASQSYTIGDNRIVGYGRPNYS